MGILDSSTVRSVWLIICFDCLIFRLLDFRLGRGLGFGGRVPHPSWVGGD